MRGLEKDYRKRGHQTNRQTHIATMKVSAQRADALKKEPCPYDPAMSFLYDAAVDNKEYMEIVKNVDSSHEWSAIRTSPCTRLGDGDGGRALF